MRVLLVYLYNSFKLCNLFKNIKKCYYEGGFWGYEIEEDFIKVS